MIGLNSIFRLPLGWGNKGSLKTKGCTEVKTNEASFGKTIFRLPTDNRPASRVVVADASTAHPPPRLPHPNPPAEVLLHALAPERMLGWTAQKPESALALLGASERKPKAA